MNPAPAVLQRGRRQIIRQLFDWYMEAATPNAGDPQLVPPAYQSRMERAATEEARMEIVPTSWRG
jgi:dGTP triphosphohydrolase